MTLRNFSFVLNNTFKKILLYPFVLNKSFLALGTRDFLQQRPLCPPAITTLKSATQVITQRESFIMSDCLRRY